MGEGLDEITLSLCVPTYNRAGCLDHLLLDIYEQLNDFSNSFEIVISDNASPDNTREIVEKWGKVLPINYSRFEVNVGGFKNLQQAYGLAVGKYLMYVADDDFLDAREVDNAIGELLNNDNAGVLFAPWKSIKYRDKDSDDLFYSQEHTFTHACGNFAPCLMDIYRFHIFPEISICKSEIFKDLIFDDSPLAYSYFTHLATWLSYCDVIFYKDAFYYHSVQYEYGVQHNNAGHQQAMQIWDSYRGGLEYFLSRFSDQLSDDHRSDFLRVIDDFIAVRMSVALRLRLSMDFGSPIDNYYLACRVCALGREEMLSSSMEDLGCLAAASSIVEHFVKTDTTQKIFIMLDVPRQLALNIIEVTDGQCELVDKIPKSISSDGSLYIVCTRDSQLPEGLIESACTVIVEPHLNKYCHPSKTLVSHRT